MYSKLKSNQINFNVSVVLCHCIRAPQKQPWRFPPGFALRKSLGSREISWIGFPNTSLVLVEHGYNSV